MIKELLASQQLDLFLLKIYQGSDTATGHSKTGSQRINNPTSRFPPSLWLTFSRWFLGCGPQAGAHSFIGGAQPRGGVPLWLGRRLFPW